jgi:hypothetical protein
MRKFYRVRRQDDPIGHAPRGEAAEPVGFEPLVTFHFLKIHMELCARLFFDKLDRVEVRVAS